MRLYLSSFRLGSETDKLLAMLGENKRAAIIMNAVDSATATERADMLEREKQALKSIGIEGAEVDLRDYFDQADSLPKALEGFGMLWINGGNTFVLRRAMQASGFDELVKDLLQRDSIVYAGYSAAACVLAPSLKIYSMTDDPDNVPEGYAPEVIWQGLGIIDYFIEPHYKSDHPESADTDREVAELERRGLPYKALRDGEVIIIDERVKQ